jgi:hypothetical protein
VCGNGRGGLERQCACPGSSHEGGWGSEAVRACRVVLWLAVIEASGGGDLWRAEPMVEADCGGQSR